MGAYSFQEQFIPHILSGRKQQTIRGIRRNPDKAGNTISCYYAQRTKHCRLLGRWTCSAVENILITPGGMVRIAGFYLEDDEREMLAYRDGFANFAEMIQFWREPNRLPFRGHIIYWIWRHR